MENNQKKESGGWNVLFIVIVIAAIVGNLKECSKDVTRSSDISISSWFSSKAYKMRWNGNMLIIEMPCPTYGIVGINEVGWGKVDVDDLLDDICDNAKNVIIHNVWFVQYLRIRVKTGMEMTLWRSLTFIILSV